MVTLRLKTHTPGHLIIDGHVIKQRLFLLFFITLLPTVLLSAPIDVPDPAPKDTCPVCGMFVAKYPEWIATVWYKDGHAHHFDGAKDLFKYLLDMPKWALGDKAENITSVGVTEYYGLKRIDAHSAFYVTGSDTLGPMGHELIPLETHEDAEEFLKDHNGSQILGFKDVTMKLLINLDKGVPKE